jgi:hypothetical protein
MMRVDLAELEQDVRYQHDDEILALIRVARTAKAYVKAVESEVGTTWFDLCVALSDIEDSRDGDR